MTKRPVWFIVLSTVALLWNLAGLFAVVADMRLTQEDVAALTLDQQALYKTRPLWSVAASLIAVAAGTLGCIGLLLGQRWALVALYASLVAVVIQDIGIFVVGGAAKSVGAGPMALQAIVLLIATGLVLLGRKAKARSWLQ